MLEDAPSGVRSAYAAGMRVIVVPDLVQPPEEVKPFIWKQARTSRTGSGADLGMICYIAHKTELYFVKKAMKSEEN